MVDDVAYAVRGHVPGLLLLPQSGYDWRVWSATAGLLSDRFSCVLLDQPGSGESPRRIEACDRVADARAVLRAAGISRCAVVAIGSSACVAMGLALDGPEVVTTVVLINPTLPEYMDPRQPTYLGGVEDSRDQALQTLIGQVGTKRRTTV